MPRSPDLERLQREVRAAITAEEAAPGAAAFASVLPALGPGESLGIYRSGWFTRLRDCLAEDFPGVRHAVGVAGFDRLVRDYLRAFPPRSHDISVAGERLPGFIAGREGLLHREFLGELATLEATVAALHTRPAPPPLSPDALRDLPPERFARARFRKAVAAEVLRFRFPVNAYFQAVRDGGAPEIPAPAATAVAVYRAEERVWRLDLTPPMLALLDALFEGLPLEEALDRCPGDAAAQVGTWFREWGQGVFGEVVLAD